MGDRKNFVWYESWWDTVMGYEEDFGEEYANELIRNIIYYGMTGEILSTKKSIIGYIQGSIAPNIDRAKERYEQAKERGKMGGRTKILKDEDNQLIADLRNQGVTQQKIAEQLGVSISTIKRSEGWTHAAQFKMVQNSSEPIRTVDTQTTQVQNQDIDNDKDIDREIDIETGLSSLRIKELAAKCNRSEDWVRTGIKEKKIEDWNKYGFGLFSKEDFIKQVDAKYGEYLKQQEEVARNAEIIKRQMENKVVRYIDFKSGQEVKKKKEIDLDSLI